MERQSARSPVAADGLHGEWRVAVRRRASNSRGTLQAADQPLGESQQARLSLADSVHSRYRALESTTAKDKYAGSFYFVVIAVQNFFLKSHWIKVLTVFKIISIKIFLWCHCWQLMFPGVTHTRW